jgi:hypothetical protein
LSPHGESILRSLRAVQVERERRAADVGLARAVTAVKQFQHKRFALTYADLMATPRYGKATAFFLEDLYGPEDFSERDAQFARVVPALVRLFPTELVGTVAELAELHALSERLDSEMAALLGDGPMDGRRYGELWRTVGDPGARARQVSLMVAVGTALDRYTRNPLLRHSLRLMRGPAQAAGLGALQRFLEKGFDTFKAMGGAREFLSIIEARERELSVRLFDGADAPTPPGQGGSGQAP